MRTLFRADKEVEMLRSRLLVVLGLLPLVTGCEGKTPLEPSQTATNVTALAITGDDSVLTGTSTSYSVSATLSNGSTRTIVPMWTSSDPAVASVNSMGGVDGRMHGSITLTANYEGRSASKTVRVVNNYSGTWQGRYIVRTCTDTGDFTDHDGGWCRAGLERVGSVLGITLTLAHSSTNASEVIGTLPCCNGTIAGIVRADGGLDLSGSVTEPDFDYPEIAIGTVQVARWESRLDGAGSMSGQWSWTHTSLTGRRGSVHTDNELVTMTRVPTIASARR
jgi:hypothetical protein